MTRPASELAGKDEAAEWLGMPGHDAGAAELKLVVRFRSVDDRDKLLREVLGVENPHVREGIPSIWWPPKETQDLASVEFQEEA